MTNTVTWQSFATSNGAAITRWVYDQQRGFLLSKKYADTSSVDYAYTAGGKVKTRTWARGVVTTYSYNCAGDLVLVSYSDGTHAVASSYDRLGRPVRVEDGAGVRSLVYNSSGQLVTESGDAGLLLGYGIQRQYDSLGRLVYLYPTVPTGTVQAVQYAYDAGSRLQVAYFGSNSVMYSYNPTSSLVRTVTFNNGARDLQVTTRTYDGLDRLTNISSSVSVTSVVNNSYFYNLASQRTQCKMGDGSTWNYGYDSLGQLTNGTRKWADGQVAGGQQYGYSYDDIGNRKQATRDTGLQTYTVNSLNQYTQRTVPGEVWMLGEANASGTVLVNSNAVSRHNDYFSSKVTVTNTSAAVYSAVEVYGTRNNVTNRYTGHMYTPKTPEVFAYDLDGNLTSDGRWAYTWDAENRLVGMETLTAVTNIVPRTKLAFTYDSQSRRVRKTVYSFTSGSWLLSSDFFFVYDGWNLIHEERRPDATGRRMNYDYVWGLDLSGSFQGAGGVGGLLSEVCSLLSSTNVSFAAYDGNGNLTDLISSTNGASVAHYEYSPFGETLQISGPMAKVNPWRFSSKYTDDETGLLNYGYRYFSPSLARWLSRDPIEEDGGENLYAMLENDSINYVDGFGLFLLAVDGTQSADWRAKGRHSHVRNFSNDYAGPGQSFFFDGPALLGGDVKDIVKSVYTKACEEYENSPNEDINMVGHSRGGLIVIEVTRKLDSEGCPCNKVHSEKHIRVNFLGLYDAVNMAKGFGNDPIPKNVSNVFHGRRSSSKGSRSSWGNTGTSGGENYDGDVFAGSHSAMGGDPWGGDKPKGLTKEADEKASKAIDDKMRENARAHGITFKKK